jgi:hypothetical protein
MMELDMLSDIHLYRHGKRQYDDLFPQKKMSFCFNHPRNPTTESRSKKFESLKYFEVRSVQEKKTRING